MRAASPRDVIPRGFACVSFWASFGSRLSHWVRRPLWLGCAGDLRPALRSSARPWQSSWSAFYLVFCFRSLGGRTPPRALRVPFVWGVAVGPTLVSPPTSVFSRFSRCGASFGPLPCHGVGAGPLGSRYGVSANSACVCVRRVFTNKQKLTPFFLRHFGSSNFLSILAFYVTYFSSLISNSLSFYTGLCIRRRVPPPETFASSRLMSISADTIVDIKSLLVWAGLGNASPTQLPSPTHQPTGELGGEAVCGRSPGRHASADTRSYACLGPFWP